MSRTAWATDTIAELGRGAGPIVQTGPFGSQLHAEDYVEDGVPFILIRNIGDGGLRPGNLPRISEADAKRLVRYSLKAGDIVFSRVGRIGSCLLATPNEEGWIISGQTLRLRLQNPDIDGQFLLNYLRSHAVQNFVSLASVGTTRESLNTKILLSIPIRYPVVEGEQRRIAEILGIVDETIEQTEALIAKQQQVKAGLMHDLFTRGLTPDGQLRPKRADAPDLYHETPLGWLPKGWESASMSSVGEIITGNTPAESALERGDRGMPFVTPGDVTSEVFVEVTGRSVVHRNVGRARPIPAGSICVVCIGSTIGKLAMVRHESITNQQINSVVCSRPELAAFYYFSASQYLPAQLRREAGLQAVPIVNKSTFSRMLVAVALEPTEAAEIQRRVLSATEALAAEAAHLDKLRQLKQGLMQVLLTPPS